MSRSQNLSVSPHRRSIPLVVVLCACAYFVSYLSRLSFTSVTVEMIATEGYAKSLIAIPLTALSITYGVGQLVCGFLGDRISPEKLVFAGLLISCGMNLSIPFCGSVALMTVLWSVNGFAQAMMWPSIVKILTNCLDEARYHQYIVYIGYASSLGTIAIYFCAPMAIALSSWHMVFYVAAGCALAFALVWLRWIHKAEAQYVEAPSTKNAPSARMVERRPFDRVAIVLLALIMVTMALQGILRDGIATWMPTYISEVFRVDSTVSILTGVALPVFSMFTMWLAAFLYRKLVKSESICSVLFFALCALAIAILCLAGSKSAVLSVSMLMVANAATHGINLMYTSMVIPRFARYGQTALVTGTINSAVYIGSAVSTYGVALVTDRFGWTGTMIVWLAAAIVGIGTALLSVKPLNCMKQAN